MFEKTFFDTPGRPALPSPRPALNWCARRAQQAGRMRIGRAALSFEEEEDERLTFTRTNNVRLQQGRGGRGRGGYASLLQKVTGGTAVSVAKEGDEMVVEDSVATGEPVA